MLMQFEPEKEVTFNAPTGIFGATLVSIKPEIDTSYPTSKQFVKFIFDLDPVPSMPDKVVKVIKRMPYSPKPNSLVRKMLKCWLGRDFLKAMGDAFSTELLIGKRAQVVIQHVFNDGYEHPFVMVESVLPPGTLNEANVFQLAA